MNEKLINWIEARLEKSLPMDYWIENDLKKLLEKLNSEK